MDLLRTRKKIILSLLLFGSLHCTLSGQLDSILLDSIVVVDRSLQSPAFYTWKKNDTESLGLDGLLKSKSAIYIREYGPSTLSTLSIRGSNSGQTRILWNGISIDNPLTGSTDLSNIMLMDFDQTQVQVTNESSVGAIGGTVELNDYYGGIKKMEGSLGYSYGSWHTNKVDGHFAYRNSKFRSKTSLLFNQTENDYTYLLTNGASRLQTNAAQRNYGLKQNSYWLINEKITLGGHYWMGYLDRKIPPKTTQTRSNAFKIDKFHRLQFTADYNGRGFQVKSAAAYLYDDNHYVDSLQLLDVFNTSRQVVLSEEFSSDINASNKVFASAEYRNTSVPSSGGIVKGKSITDVILEARWQWQIANNMLRFGLGNQIRDGLSPLLINANWSHDFGDKFSAQLSLAKNFRRPALNDLFWVPGGNPELLPEEAYQSDLRLNYLGLSIASYYKIIENWILWKPSQESFLFSARNIARVRSYGLDVNFSQPWVISERLSSHWTAALAVNRTFSLEDVPEIKIIAKEQLIYSPRFKASGTVDLSFANFAFIYNHLYTSSVTTELEPSDSFQLGNLTLAYQRQIRKKIFKISVTIDNLWDTDYRVVPREAMPGRSITMKGQINL